MDAPMPSDHADLVEARAALASAAVIISSYRWKLRDAGYPFREPPGIDTLIARIDAILFPELQTGGKRRRRGDAEPSSPAARAAADALMALRC